MSGRAVAFLDRDGVINADRGYVHDIENFEFLPGVPEALRKLRGAGYLLIVVTNQSGIGRGLYSEAKMHELHSYMQAQLAAHGGALDAIYHCPHDPIQGCECRKPLPGLLLQAMNDFDIDRKSSFIVGDKPSDLAAGAAAGLGAGYLIWSDGKFQSLLDCVDAILATQQAVALRSI